MLQPKRLKHRKFQRGRMKGAAQRGNRITKGDYALKAMEPCWMTARQIEAARRAVTHHFKRGGAVWINVFPDKPVTKKPAEVRMGSGKGAPDHWVAVVRPGRVILEVGGVSRALAKEALRLAAYKLPIRTQFIAREELFDAKFKLATRQLKNFRTMPQARRKIARLLTVMRERTTESETNG